MEPIVSFCIASYMRQDRTVDLVKEILQFHHQLIEVVVSDDHSSDNTFEVLSEICDKRLKICQNEENLGPRMNWYRALEMGSGKYLIQVLDRDWIRASEIEEIINILQETDAGFGYFGIAITSRYTNQQNSNRFELYSAGIEALKKFACVPTHPTGHFFRKSVWDSIKNKKKFFLEDKWGIYPHGYICAMASLHNSGIIIRGNFCVQTEKIKWKYRDDKSKFYQNSNNRKFWWMPEEKMKELIAVTYLINWLPITDVQKREIVVERFYDELYAATIKYKYNSQDIDNARHYNINVKYIRSLELRIISISFLICYLRYIKDKKFQWMDGCFKKSIRAEFIGIMQKLSEKESLR